MEHVTNALSRLSSVLTKYIGMIIICFSVIAFFWRDGFAWTTNYTSIFLGVAMFGMTYTCKVRTGDVMKGDVNGDGKIKMNDVMAIYNYLIDRKSVV